ncbi:AMP-binding protein domain protein [Sporothrix brasiliensis 5110]|uniref:AMP-binding protein domain protein n=1 Tax=Sporothrix brasiliensis 5110 TaxID=1398154 RepID=A0A0C2IUU2_9PEZI|nr:AMP-binding protein domain protein [Sporothrix brasiliensis 5110]KIH92926.1 AMP-binding protein domain protein [Sporothrix brasiliensis 5110]
MSGPQSRLGSVLRHLVGANGSADPAATSTASTASLPVFKHVLTPTTFLERAAAIEPDAEAIVHITANGRTLRRNYAEFADRARGLAWYFAHHGYRRIGILAPNTPAFLETIFASGAANAVLVPANYRLIAADVAYIFDFADVDIIVADAQCAPLLTEGSQCYASIHPTVPILVDDDVDTTQGELRGAFDTAVLEGLQFEAHRPDAEDRTWAGLHRFVAAQPGYKPVDEDDTIAIPFTSGTTAKPKGVEYTHRGAYLAALANVAEAGLNAQDDHNDSGSGSKPDRCRYLWTLPMFHAVGWTFPWSVCAVRGTHVCLRKIDYPLIWKLLREEGVTHFNAAPTVNTLLCAATEATRLERPVKVTVAASPPTAHLFEQMTKLNLHPVHVYGMTETYGPITRGYILPSWNSLPGQQKFERMARQGHGFLTSMPVRVIKTDEDSNPVTTTNKRGEVTYVDVPRDARTIGEIVFQGNICAKGYFKDPAATEKLFAGGVLHSGDLAVMHPDGSVQILDRAKDIIISGGENISSVALESILVQHPDVLEAAVVAVPDSHWGERPKAYLTTKPTAEPGRPGTPLVIDEQAFLDWVRHQSGISRFMVPREMEVVTELPKTSTGKLQKNVLRQWALKGAPDNVKAAH